MCLRQKKTLKKFKNVIAFPIGMEYYNRACGSLAQLVEQLTLNQWVEGSSPSGTTILLQVSPDQSGV